VRSTIVLTIACLAACRNTPLVSNAGAGADGSSRSPVNEQDTGVAPQGSGSSGGGPLADTTDARDAAPLTAPDADAALDAATDHGPLISCAAVAAGGQPDGLKGFQWQYMVGTLDKNNRPYDSVTIDSGCVLTYQRTNPPLDAPPTMRTSTTRDVTMTPADCAAARGWATNARFLSVLETGDGCPYGPGNPDDLFEVDLTDGSVLGRKTYLCPEPTLDAVRACMSGLVTRLFP
jgi:hypothetical protein